MLPSRHLLGEPAAGYGYTDKITLLQCECGEAGCWPLEACVTVTDQTVTWSDFEQPHRRGTWRYDALGPFVFDRRQYERALEAFGRRLVPRLEGPPEHVL